MKSFTPRIAMLLALLQAHHLPPTPRLLPLPLTHAAPIMRLLPLIHAVQSRKPPRGQRQRRKDRRRAHAAGKRHAFA